jgi:secondary thiamine-phosphate synthase enzyme
MIELSLKTTEHSQFVNITPQVQQFVDKSDWFDGVVTVFNPHTTAGLTIQENADPDVVRDMLYALDKTYPWSDPKYRHAEGNTAAHLKASTMGSSIQIILVNGQLKLGTWQGIYFCEFDGPRSRNIWLTFTPVPHTHEHN